MKITLSLSLSILIFSLCACSTPESIKLSEQLKTDPQWNTIRSYAQKEIKQREGSLGWAFVLAAEDNNSLVPTRKEDDVWTLVAAADYPNNRYGEIVDMTIKEDGTVLTYKNRLESENE